MTKLNLIFTARYHYQKKGLLQDFAPFDPNKLQGESINPRDVKKLENRLFSNLREMLGKANFSMMEADEVEEAVKHTFKNTVPIEPDWLKLEPMFQSYMHNHKGALSWRGVLFICFSHVFPNPDLAEKLPSFSTRIWLFQRGMGKERLTGRLVMQKIDILLEKLLSKCCCLKASKSDATAATQAKPGERGVQRISLRAQVEKEGLLSLFRESEVQEPSFKEMVLIYRMNAGRDDQHVSSNHNAIYIKVFRDIPQGDMELIYPCKSTGFRAMDIVKFVGAGIFGVLSILTQRQAGELAGYSAIGGFVGMLTTVLFNYQYQISVYQQATLGDLYMKTKDSDSGAISYIMQEVILQEVKEALLGYYFLTKATKPMSQEELDGVVESFLADLQQKTNLYVDCKIDFEVDDALGKLQTLDVVNEPQEGKFLANPLAAALGELEGQWEGMITEAEQ